MARERTALSGRDDELAELGAALAGVTAHRHTLAVVRGTPGIGKSALLTVVGQRWRRDGATVVEISFGAAGVAPWDAFGVQATIAALRKHLERSVDVALADAINAVSRLCTPETYASPKLRSRLLVGLAKIFGRLRREGPLVVIADDVDAVTNPTLAITPACLPGCLVLAACRDDGRFAAAPVQLAPLADHLVDLGPLSDEHAFTLLGQRIGAAPDDSLQIALRRALGPLMCDPGTLLSTVDELRAAGRIVTVHGKACLAGDEPVVLAAGHDLVRQVRALDAAGHDLVALAATGPVFGIDDLPALAAVTGNPLAAYGQAVDTLVAVGALFCTESGQLSCGCRALADAVLAGTRAEVARLHGELAEYQLTAGVGDAVIAGHLAAAGRDIAPSAELAFPLVTAADRAVTAEPARAAVWYHAALWHLGSDSERPRVVSTLVSLLQQLGQYGKLAALIAEYPETTGAVPRAGRELIANPLAWHEKQLAGDALDLTRLLPAGHGVPADGPLSHYQRLVTRYARGEWQGALSAARELMLTGSPDSVTHRLGALLAAEISTGLGELKEAAAWLPDAGEDDRLIAMRAWVETGLLAASGDSAEALAAGWWAYRRIPADETRVGGERLLARLAVVAMAGGQEERGRAILAEMADLDERAHSLATRAALLFVRGVVDADETSLSEAAELAREQDRLPELLVACLELGRLADQPRPWLHEAHELAGRAGAAPSRAQAMTLMRRRGVATPRAEGDRTGFSDRELRIVDLIRDGRTNRQVAVALQVTEKTVEYYLSRLFVKTGCRSRIDLAAASARGQLTAVSA
ncbi:helix-turn-helix transcriptional regulator [Amycolatopsis pithecellobii]|uniref:AAA family ATPase n=1 Tax=Amycolatopsis pithecellobii TaxID=664692 RepID=A0A6N7Z5J7_9PSEU|nr:LuxR family transcriptional regulator [Amycolatopsis pithecellobii]MTD55820.1 AAA family ATPase [Amycolatopsis pithecellobii]